MGVIDNQKRGELLRYIDYLHSRSYPATSIKKVLINRGYDPNAVNNLVNQYIYSKSNYHNNNQNFSRNLNQYSKGNNYNPYNKQNLNRSMAFNQNQYSNANRNISPQNKNLQLIKAIVYLSVFLIVFGIVSFTAINYLMTPDVVLPDPEQDEFPDYPVRPEIDKNASNDREDVNEVGKNKDAENDLINKTTDKNKINLSKYNDSSSNITDMNVSKSDDSVENLSRVEDQDNNISDVGLNVNNTQNLLDQLRANSTVNDSELGIVTLPGADNDNGNNNNDNSDNYQSSDDVKTNEDIYEELNNNITEERKKRQQPDLSDTIYDYDLEEIKQNTTSDKGITDYATRIVNADRNDAIELCETIDGSRSKDECYSEIAKAAVDETICDMIDDLTKKDSCIMHFINIVEDDSICYKISNKWMQQSCISLQRANI